MQILVHDHYELSGKVECWARQCRGVGRGKRCGRGTKGQIVESVETFGAIQFSLTEEKMACKVHSVYEESSRRI
jgi:ribosomal protein L15